MGCCLRRIWSCVVTLLLLALALYLAFRYVLVPQVTGKLEQTVRREFELDEEATVVIRQGSPVDVLRGRFDFLMLKADNAVIDELPVEDLLVRADGVSVDVWQSLGSQQAEITGLAAGFVEFKVAEEPLAERWTDELAKVNLAKPELTLDDGFAKVTGLFSLGPLKQKVTVSGQIEPTETGEVRFSAGALEVAGAELNLSPLKSAFKTLDPVVDLGQLELDLDVTEISVDDGYIYIAAQSAPFGDAVARPAAADQDDIEVKGWLAERFRQISLVNRQERAKQLEQLYEQLKAKGVTTAEQVEEFTGRQLAGLRDEYRWLLKELNEVVERQIKALDKREQEEEEPEGKEQDPAGAPGQADGQDQAGEE